MESIYVSCLGGLGAVMRPGYPVLVFLIEHYTQAWAKDFLSLLTNMKEKVDTAKSLGQSALSELQLAAFEHVYDLIVEVGERANPPPIRQPNQRGRLTETGTQS